ncbi:unnamed protein product [Danaus chrysippus]|uniref:(African queen) hypothetical protein n=1 Tax=Danaus chrysippus TaxID=151541 RepID=A0A8J2QP44_9NEOP|nr:unnamed protein product [Danaus chrysippus]
MVVNPERSMLHGACCMVHAARCIETLIRGHNDALNIEIAANQRPHCTLYANAPFRWIHGLCICEAPLECNFHTPSDVTVPRPPTPDPQPPNPHHAKTPFNPSPCSPRAGSQPDVAEL